jgi:alkylation response protein AidB-like acyl-CoA dehydrogenase
LRQISGDDEFNEVFFDDVFVPRSQLVGQIGEGWKIALSTLMYERVVLTFSRHIQSERVLRDLLRLSSEGVLLEDESRRLADCITTFSAVRALAYKHLYSYANGATPGPEGSMDKLFWSESFQELSQLALAITSRITFNGANEHPWLRLEAAEHRYLYSRGRTIAAGTSEIQRTIIAERILGLPRLKASLSEI